MSNFRNPGNGHISAKWPKIKNLRTLCVLELLKFGNSMYLFDFGCILDSQFFLPAITRYNTEDCW